MAVSAPNAFTISQIANALGVEVYRLNYVIGKFRIKESYRVGIARVYGPDELALIKDGLTNINKRSDNGSEPA